MDESAFRVLYEDTTAICTRLHAMLFLVWGDLFGIGQTSLGYEEWFEEVRARMLQENPHLIPKETRND